MPELSIIGTAGRGKTGRKMTRALYMKMVRHARNFVQERFSADTLRLVSGGAAWADHLAVSLYLTGRVKSASVPPPPICCNSLVLHMPAPWMAAGSMYHDTGVRNWKTNPGGTANFYHSLFGKRMNGDHTSTLHGINNAIGLGAVYNDNYAGFHARNAAVAGSQYILAYTWGEGDVPADGGTRHTWNLAKGERFHIPLSSLVG
tara:strand:- start:3101 stop:3709 length:609 start_codon:yes stop_codon:yes gene_type:complete